MIMSGGYQPKNKKGLKKPKNTMENNFTNKDRICLNCKHLRRDWNLVGIVSLIASDGRFHYRCIRNLEEEMDPITGRVMITGNELSCRYARGRDLYCENGEVWEPSKKFLNKKENLFKVIVSTGDNNEKL